MKSTKEEYNADALVKLENLELCILETSGKYGLKDDPRFGYDQVKGTFSALSMLRSIIKKFRYAIIETLQKLKVYFIHARDEKIHLWSLEIPPKDLQFFQRLAVTELPLQANESVKILDFGNFFWKLKQCISESMNNITQMEKEHQQYVLSTHLSNSTETRPYLFDWIEREIQKPEKGNGFGLLFREEDEDYDVQSNIIAL